MKPDWKDAPEWANWLACDSDGTWTWYKNKPKILWTFWVPEMNDCLLKIAKKSRAKKGAFWETTLEERPKAT